MKPYFSPFNLLENKENPILSYEKGRILDKLNASANKTITVESNSFNEGEILNAFESLENKTEFAYHKAIYNNKGLLNFLELRPGSNAEQINSLKRGNTDADFKQFILPYFQHSLATLTNRAFFDQDIEGLKSLNGIDSFIPNNLLPAVFSEIDKHIELDFDKLRKLISTGQHTKLQNLSEYFQKNKLLCIDALPSYFDVKKSYYMGLLLQIGRSNMERKNYALSLTIFKSLEFVEIPENSKAQFEKDLKYLKIQNRTNPQSFSSGGQNNIIVGIIAGTITVVLILAVILSISNRSKKDKSSAEKLFSIESMNAGIRPYYKKAKGTKLVKYYYAERYKELIANEPPENIKVRNKERRTPYRRVLTKNEFNDCLYLSKLKEQYIKVSNSSEYDAVLFFVKKGIGVAGHSYVYAGDVKHINFTPFKESAVFEYDVYAYVGRGWNDFFRFRAGNQGFNGMFEYQPECCSGIVFTNITFNFGSDGVLPLGNAFSLETGYGGCEVVFGDKGVVL